jgi:tetratricopeptide (TPR) repeat protein
MALPPGLRLGAYEILSALGAGGFGEVYKARDLRLDRTVAIKILPSADAELRGRFEREAKTIATLHHPHICTLFDIGNHDGIDYLVLEYLEGETLAQRLERGRLGTDEALGIATEIAGAIDDAHKQHIVHRDLKPANVMLTANGAKLLDFGLAKLRVDGAVNPSSIESTRSTPAVTAQGSLLGTLHYMAPEQLEGKEADSRSDIWAFGCLLYEMFTGSRLFDAPRAQPIAIRPRRVARVIRKCVERDPARRWRSIGEVRSELRPRRRTASDLAWISAAIGAVAVIALLAFRARLFVSPSVHPQQPQTVLVADFRNSTGEDVFDGVIDRAVAVALESSSFINVYARRDAMTAAAQIGHVTGLDETASRLVSRREGIATFITGGIAKGTSGYDLSAAVIDTVSGTPVAFVTEKGVAKAGVLNAVARISEKLRSSVGDTVVSSGGDLARETFTTSSLDAAKAYTTAQDLAAGGSDDEAIGHYQDAVRIDPEFGRAYAGWALSVDRVGRSREAADLFEKAISLLARMNRRERLRTEGVYAARVLQDYVRADQIYRTLVSEYPADTAARNNLAVSDFMLLRFADAFEQGRLAVAMSPNYVSARVNLALYAMYDGQFDSAAEHAEYALRLNDKASKAYIALGVAAAVRGRNDEAQGWYDKMRTTTAQGAWLSELALADLDASRNRVRDAEQRLVRLVTSDAAAQNTTAIAHGYAFLAEIAAAEGRTADVVRLVDRGRPASSDPHFGYRYASALLDVNKIDAAIRVRGDLKRSRSVQAENYGVMLDAELAARNGGQPLRVLEAAQKAGAWWAFYRAAVVLSRAHRAEGERALRWCREHRAQGTAAFLNDVPTLRYYVAVDQPAGSFR